MSRRSFQYYSLTTGRFTQRVLQCRDEKLAELNAPEGHGFKEGAFDHLCERVDLATGEVIEYQPDRPDEYHEWDEKIKRWRKRVDVQQREAAKARAQTKINEIEIKQLRSMRELALDPANSAAKARLEQLETQVAELRKDLNGREVEG
jgi:hypothetical protein